MRNFLLENRNLRLKRLIVQDWDSLTNKISIRFLMMCGALILVLWSFNVTITILLNLFH